MCWTCRAELKVHLSCPLSYACRYYGEHLRQGNATNTAHEKLVDSLTHRLLFWMEVLNLGRSMVIGTLRQVQIWLKVREHAYNLSIQTEMMYIKGDLKSILETSS